MGKSRSIQDIYIAISYCYNLRCKHGYVPQNERIDYKLLGREPLFIGEINNFFDFIFSNLDLKKVTLTGSECLPDHVWRRTKPVLQHSFDQEMDIQINPNSSGKKDIRTQKTVKDESPTCCFPKTNLQQQLVKSQELNVFLGTI